MTTGAAASDQRPPLTGRLLAASGALGIAINLFKAGLQIVTLPVMASLLSPTDFGLFAIAQPIVGFGWMLADAGLGASLAREPEGNHAVWATAWWFVTGLGIALAAALSLAGVLLGLITMQPRLAGIIAIMSLALIAATQGVVAGARLDRRARLLTGSKIELVALIVSFATAIGCAYAGAGAYSLAAQFVVLAVVRSVGVNLLAFRWPGWQFQPRLLRGHLGTGGAQIAGRLLDLGDKLLSNAVLQRTIGVADLGSYSLGVQACRFGTEMIANTSWLLLYLQGLRGEPARTQMLFRHVCRALAVLLLPAALLVAAAAPFLVPTVLGARWHSAALVIQITLPVYAFGAIAGQPGALLLAAGRYAVALRISVLCTALRLGCTLFGGWIGLEGIAYGVAAIGLVQSALMLRAGQKDCGLRIAPVLRTLFGPTLAGAVGAATFLLAAARRTDTLQLWVCLSAAALVSLAALVVVDRAHLSEDVGLMRRLLLRRDAAGPA